MTTHNDNRTDAAADVPPIWTASEIRRYRRLTKLLAIRECFPSPPNNEASFAKWRPGIMVALEVLAEERYLSVTRLREAYQVYYPCTDPTFDKHLEAMVSFGYFEKHAKGVHQHGSNRESIVEITPMGLAAWTLYEAILMEAEDDARFRSFDIRRCTDLDLNREIADLAAERFAGSIRVSDSTLRP